jgi:hypothetical protein
MRLADLVVLDSDLDVRFEEITRCKEHGKSGSQMIIHDTPEFSTPLTSLTKRIKRLEYQGHFLDNQRGGWHGIHP